MLRDSRLGLISSMRLDVGRTSNLPHQLGQFWIKSFKVHVLTPFSNERSIFLDNIRSINENVLWGSDSRISETLLFGISFFNDTENTSILNTTIDYILSTKDLMSLLPTFDLFFNISSLKISFNFHFFNAKSFTKFLPYYIIRLGIYHLRYLPCQLGFSSNYHYFMLVYILLSFLFIVFQSKSLNKLP